MSRLLAHRKISVQKHVVCGCMDKEEGSRHLFTQDKFASFLSIYLVSYVGILLLAFILPANMALALLQRISSSYSVRGAKLHFA